MKLALLTLVAIIARFGDCDEVASINILEQKALDGGENEHVWVDLKKMNPETNEISEEIQMQVSLHFHLKQGIVHLNGRPCHHSLPNAIHLLAQIKEITNGAETHRQEHVVVRVLVDTHLNANKRIFTIEEEVIAVGREEVTQVDVKQIIIESDDNVNESRRSLLVLKVSESKLHMLSRDHDHHSGDLRPILPDSPLYSDEDEEDDEGGHRHHHKHGHGGHGHRHHRRHHGFLHRISCWFHRLSMRSRICLFIVVVLFCITMCMCCSFCCKRRHRRKMQMVKIMNDDIADAAIQHMTVDMEEVKVGEFKKGDEGINEFHFEIEDEHKVDVDDKKQLLM